MKAADIVNRPAVGGQSQSCQHLLGRQHGRELLLCAFLSNAMSKEWLLGNHHIIQTLPMTRKQSPGALFSISAVVPVYQCAERFPRHLDALEAFSRKVRELIWVITHSEDGSHRLAFEAANRLGGKVMEVPRGLYQAWNTGIAAAEGDFIYMSTIGDTIGEAGLTRLAGILETAKADLVISPPEIYPATYHHRSVTAHWPLFRFSDALAPYALRRIPRPHAMLMQILSGASGLAGSCASCLFRTSVVRNRPFPTDYHHYGDTAWMYLNLPGVDLAYCPEKVARFWIHDPKIHRVVDKKQIYSLSAELCVHLPGEEQELVRRWIDSMIDIDAYRGPSPLCPWWLSPDAWRSRWRRDQIQAELTRKLF